jgi:hypothetical protein
MNQERERLKMKGGVESLGGRQQRRNEEIRAGR